MNADKRVLITGAAGFVGQCVARALAAAGYAVTGLDREALRTPSRSAHAYEAFLTCDLLDDKALSVSVEGRAFEVVVHLAGRLSTQASRADLFAVNTGGTAAVLERCTRPGAHVIFFSTGLVYGRQPGPFHEETQCLPIDAYAQSKLAAEAVALAWSEASGSPLAIVRPSVLYGPDAPPSMLLVSLLQTLRKGEPFAMTLGAQLRDFLHVEDAARAVVRLVAERAHGTWNLASGESVSVRQAAALGASIAKRPDLLKPGALPYRDSEVFDYRLDARKLRERFDWQPSIDLQSGLTQMWRAVS
jgi:nucleoside-diphosphate-sugar epimerase